MNEHNNQSNAIKADDLQAFHAVLKQQGCQENDYHASIVAQEKDWQHSAKKEAPQQGVSRMENQSSQNAKNCCNVAVKNEKTGKEKTYQAGDGHQWVKDFENDLKNHQFK